MTLKDHLRELEVRLFAVGVVFIGAAAAAYPFFDKISHFITAPLKSRQELVYLTPGGAFSFIIKVCIYVGLVAALPFIIFNLYRFIMPAVKKSNMRMALTYTLFSLFLAIGGVIFAYYVSLPASLYFLTGFSLQHINPMLTVDSYFSFVMTYVLAGALLFQLPLVMLIINTAKPLTPRKLMSYQRHIIVGSFIVAAIITPTPDPWNQTLLAAPVIVMYQLGITLVWAANRKRMKQHKRLHALTVEPETATAAVTVAAVKPSMETAGSGRKPAISSTSHQTQPRRAMSDIRRMDRITSKPHPVAMPLTKLNTPQPVRGSRTAAATVRVPTRGVDVRRAQPLSASHSTVCHVSNQRSLDGIVVSRQPSTL